MEWKVPSVAELKKGTRIRSSLLYVDGYALRAHASRHSLDNKPARLALCGGPPWIGGGQRLVVTYQLGIVGGSGGTAKTYSDVCFGRGGHETPVGCLDALRGISFADMTPGKCPYVDSEGAITVFYKVIRVGPAPAASAPTIIGLPHKKALLTAPPPPPPPQANKKPAAAAAAAAPLIVAVTGSSSAAAGVTPVGMARPCL
jgi:hypothetical protein